MKVVDERAAPKYIRDYQNIIIDTSARPETEELQALADGCDLLLLPTTPDAMSLDALSLTVSSLKSIGVAHYQVLLTIIPPPPTRDGEEARGILTEADISLLKAGIRRLIVFQRAALQGVPVYEMNDSKARVAWSDYVAVGKELIGE